MAVTTIYAGAPNDLLISYSVMAGLVPAIHVALRARMDVDARDKPGHDVVETGERNSAGKVSGR